MLLSAHVKRVSVSRMQDKKKKKNFLQNTQIAQPKAVTGVTKVANEFF